MKMKFQIPNSEFRIPKSGRKTNSQFAIRNSQFSRAFTLIEIMVAIAIFMLLIAALYSTWVLILKSTQVIDEAAAQVQRQRIAVRTIEDSLTCIQSFQASMKYYMFGVTNGDPASLSYVARVPEIFPRNGRFDTDLRRLTFTVETSPDSDSEKDLVLRQNPILMDMDEQEQQTPLVLARNVKDFKVECWDTNALDWVDEWDDTNSIPPMVRVTLALGGNTTDSGNVAPTLTITREIAMPSGTLPIAAQQPRIAPAAGVNATNGPITPNQPHPEHTAASRYSMMKFSRRNNSISGMALIMVMIAIAVFTGLVAALALTMKVETRLARNADDEQQLLWLGRSGVEYARWILAQSASIPGEPYDSLNQIWAGGPGGVNETNGPLAGISMDNFPVGAGTVSLKIIDLERKVNINTATQPEIQQALTLMGADANDISVVSDSILDWIDPPAGPRIAGAESDYYLGLSPPYHAKNAPIDDLSELLLVKGVTPEMYWGGDSSNSPVVQRPHQQKLGFGNAPGQIPDYPFGLKDVFTAVSSGRININTADANVLQMIPGVDNATADAIIKQRAGPDGVDGTDDDTPFRSPNELAAAGVSPQAMQVVGTLCTVRSSTFEVHVTAHIGDSSREFIAIIFRNSGTDVRVVGFYWK